ncbi:MAG: hypothetical protein ABI612_12320 [Betaproteobacteria bacterium]
MFIDRWLTRWSPNYAFLRKAVREVGSELARRPYDAMLQPGEEFSFAQFVDGVHIDFEVEVFRIDLDKTMWIRVEPRAKLWTPLELKPSYTFRKLPDGRAFALL